MTTHSSDNTAELAAARRRNEDSRRESGGLLYSDRIDEVLTSGFRTLATGWRIR